MDDLIKRQDAITAYCEHECGIKGMTRENCGAIDCGTIFDDIPSAQQWIPCSERLPYTKDDYIITVKDKSLTWTDYVEWSADYHWWGYDDDMVIAWMPLPEPYKGADT